MRVSEWKEQYRIAQKYELAIKDTGELQHLNQRKHNLIHYRNKQRNEELELFEFGTYLKYAICVFNRYCPSNPSTPATVQSTDPMNPTLSIYLEILEVKDSTINYHGICFESIIYHELLHACGDSPALRKEIQDGVIRHTTVCNEAINNLCKQSGNSSVSFHLKRLGLDSRMQ